MKHFNQVNNLLLCLGLLKISACASITAMQGAETLKAKETKTVVGLGYSKDLQLNKGDGETTAIPSVDVLVRYGLTDQDEVAARASNYGSYLELDYKRAIINSSKFLLSVGAGIGGTKFSVGSGENLASTTILDFYLPVYVDFPMGEKLSLLASPKLIQRFVITSEDSSANTQAALSGGVKFGKDSGVILEAAYAKELSDSKSDYFQVMASIFW